MSQDNVNVKNDPTLDPDALPVQHDSAGRTPRARLWVNWALALLTGVGAGVVMAVALGAVMSTAACSDKACPNLGGGISFDILYYGAPAVAVVTIVLSIFTARRRWGLVVPMTALALLIADAAVIVTTVAQ